MRRQKMKMDFKGFGFEGFGFEETSKKEGKENAVVSQKEISNNGWGFSLDDFYDLMGDKKDEKKDQKKKPVNKNKAAEKPKKEMTQNTSKNADVDVKLPVTVIARGFEKRIEGTGLKKISEIAKMLLEDGYSQLEIPGMGLFYVNEADRIYVADGTIVGTADDTQVDLSEDRNVTVVDGLLTATFSAADFADKEKDEISAKDIADRFAQINPYYQGCKIRYEESLRLCYPVFESYEYNKPINPVQVMIKGTVEDLGASEFADIKELKEYLVGNLSGKNNLFIAKTAKDGVYAVAFSSRNAYCLKETKSVKANSTKKVAEKYPLPLQLYIVTFNCFYDLKSEHFDGKDKVTLEEIKQYMADKQRMFADPARKLDVLYNEEMNRLAVMFVSGSKGCEMLRSKEEFEEAQEKEMFHGFFVEEEGTYDVMSLPHGTFITLKEKESRGGAPVSLTFKRKLPKMPLALLQKIVNYFREDLDSEAMVRIVYNRKKEEFHFYKANGSRSKAYIKYNFEADSSYFDPNMVQVMEIHSHNTMDAFFSMVDDKDESGYPGVFGVIGRLHEEKPSIRLRAGNNGVFTNVALKELFEG